MLVEPPPSQFDLKWHMLGMPVRVHPLFWLITLVFGWSGSAGRWDLILTWVACVFVSILVHELGHALVARATGAEGVRIVLYGMGGLALHQGGDQRRWQRVVELLMGPGAGFVLAGIVYAVWFWGAMPRLTTVPPLAVFYAVTALLQINLFWGLVNLLPVYPLDGGQIAWELLDAPRRRERRVLTHKLGIGVGVGVAILFVATTRVLGVADAIGLFPALLFLLLAFDNWRLMQIARTPAWIGDEAPREPWERDPDWWKGR